jgi:hypothetical protein
MASLIQAIVGCVTGIIAELFIYFNFNHSGLLKLILLGALIGLIMGFITLTGSFIGVVLGVIVTIFWFGTLNLFPFISPIWTFLMALFVGACASNGSGMVLP